jgi:hypothetical protein
MAARLAARANRWRAATADERGDAGRDVGRLEAEGFMV